MAVSELSLDAIHEYILGKGGKVANRELVHHFKKYLINADKNEARIRFKEYVNKIACSKTENGEKFIILRSKYASALASPASTPVSSALNTVGLPSNSQDVSPVPSPSKARHPPPYRPPPPVSSPSPSIDNISLCSSSMSIKDMEEPPQAPPRRKSQSSRTLSVEVEEPPSQQQEQQQQQQSEPIAIPQPQAVENSEQAISVKERTQKFNRLASVENDLSPQPSQTQKERRRQPETGADEDDGASVTSLDNKRTEWVVAAARGDYQALAKLATANPRLVKTKEPFSYTALHWAAKHGNSDIIKLIAGTYSADVNARTNGGYTALHIAMQFGRKEISELLIDVYHAQRDIRDWSGKTAEYYSTTRRNTSKSDNYHKMKIMKKSSEKDLGFLRIGSLNVRVKKTTEAFSNFLGVGGSSGSITPIDHVLEKVHKSWGSADNVSKDNEMAAPKLMPHNKRKLKYTQEQITSYSTPGTPNQKRALPTHHHNPDSDSDTACGFDSNWKQ